MSTVRGATTTPHFPDDPEAECFQTLHASNAPMTGALIGARSPGFESDDEDLRATGHAICALTSANVVFLTTVVDLWGRLSNPDDPVETSAGQGSRALRRSPNSPREGPNLASRPSGDAPPEERGRLSNPVQRRLSQAEIEQLIHQYREGAPIDGLARRHEVHRTTVIHHLDQAGVTRRRVVRKMTDESVALAAARYAQGASLKIVASEFAVHQRTLARELRRAGTAIRLRRGWTR